MQRDRTAAHLPATIAVIALVLVLAGLFSTSAGATTAQCYPPPCGGGGGGGGGGGTTTTSVPGATTTTTAAPGATTTTTVAGGSTTTTVKTATTTTTLAPGAAPAAGAPGTTAPPRGVLSRTGAALTKPLVALALAIGLFGLLLVVLVRRAEVVRPR